jgi:tRNA 2-thiouridine synthesizing protein C
MSDLPPIPPDDDEDEFGVVKKFMYVNRRAPYGTVYALESLEMVLIAAAFDQDVSVVFMDDGVFQIKKGQETADINMKNFSPTFRALEGYDVEKLYVSKKSLEERGLTEEDLLVPVEVLDQAALAALMAEQEVIITA